MGSAQLEMLPEGEVAGEVSALRLQAAERLAAHRQRRAAGMVEAVSAPSRGPKHKAAAAVAERYAQTPSFRAVLAAEAQKAIEEAAAQAEVAARNAAAVAAAQAELLAELEKYEEPVVFTPETAVIAAAVPAAAAPVREVSAAGLTVRLYEDVGARPAVEAGVRNKAARAAANADEARALDEEIAFRQAPVFEDYRAKEPAVPLPANLLEFPRQLIAAKKQRPRLAEGPLREDPTGGPQLRIFEVAAVPVPEVEVVSALPEWSDIRLGAHTVTEVMENPDLPAPALLASLLPPEVAPMHLRLMAAATDMVIVAAGFVAFCATAARVAGRVPTGATAAIIAVTTLAALYFVYQGLCFTLSDHTPGMRYARIGLCTFSDENPSRSAMRKRILAQVVAVCPLGLGVLWVLLDDDRLGWHDRISRMYQRAY